MKKIIAMLLCLCMMASLFAATALAEEPEEAAGEYRLGLGVSLSTASSKAENAQVDATTAAVVLDAEGKIVAVKIDVAQSKMTVTDGQVETEKEFQTKLERGEAYDMRKASAIGKEWFEQAEAFEQFLIGKTVEEVEAMETETLENGHVVSTDEELLAGCSISIGEFKEAVVKACKDEQGMDFTAAGDFQLGLAIITKADESKAATEDEDGVVKMYSEYAAVVVDKDGVILAALTDATQPKIAIDAEGEIGDVDYKGTKREITDAYDMRKASAIGKEWFEQAAAFEQYAVGKTAGELLATETKENNGHIVFADEELYATCSISITGMINVVAKAANNALGGEYKLGLGVSLSTASSKAENAQVDATTAAVVLDGEGKIVAVKIDVAQSKMTVTDGQVETEKEFQTKLERGEAYDMRKASAIGKEWFEQAEAFEQFLIGKTVEEVEAMETETLENGHVVSTDEELLAGCSISIGEFKEAVVKACKDEQGMDFTAAGDFQLGLAIITKADESKAATEDEDGVVKMYSEYAAVVVDKDGVILAALTDATQPKIAIDAEGEIGDVDYKGTKREITDAYDMRKASAIGKEWFEQAAAFEQYAIGKTAEELLATETKENNGHIVFADEELYAGCSISITGMINVVAKAAGNAIPVIEEKAA